MIGMSCRAGHRPARRDDRTTAHRNREDPAHRYRRRVRAGGRRRHGRV